MNAPDSKIRFDELSAGRAMGDLCMDEQREFASLSAALGLAPDPDFDLLAASIEIEALQQASLAPLPASLAARLHQWADQTATPAEPAKVITPTVPAWKIIARSPISGWTAAAAAIAFALLMPREDKPVPPALAESRLRSQAKDLIERSFSGLGDFKQAGGNVIWSDQLQQGFMTLTGIPANDPKQAQYQLWIVDPARDADAPVDGGVFDIPADGAPVIVPIAAKLALNQPQAFVITLEQPGGVVKSKQEKVVALAKN